MLTYDELKNLDEACKNNAHDLIIKLCNDLYLKGYNKGFNDGYDTCKEDIFVLCKYEVE